MWDNEADRNIFLEVLMCDKNQVELSPERQERIRYWSGHMEGNWGNEVKGLNDEGFRGGGRTDGPSRTATNLIWDHKYKPILNIGNIRQYSVKILLETKS